MTARPVVSTLPPNHWSTFRRPQTDDERLELAAMAWNADENLERALLVRERHRDVFEPLSATVLRLDSYEKVRAMKVAEGKEIRVPAIALGELDAAAAFLRAHRERPNPDALNRAGLVAFRDVARSGDWETIRTRYLTWRGEVLEARRALERWFSAHQVLGQPRTRAGENRTQVPRLSDLLDSALGGFADRPAAMLPDDVS